MIDSWTSLRRSNLVLRKAIVTIIILYCNGRSLIVPTSCQLKLTGETGNGARYYGETCLHYTLYLLNRLHYFLHCLLIDKHPSTLSIGDIKVLLLFRRYRNIIVRKNQKHLVNLKVFLLLLKCM